MPAVLVHGVPDTHRVWNDLIAYLERDDVITLSLPGFGVDLPAGFDASKEAYVDWLLGELAEIDGPIDLVGHDWGSLLVVRAVSLRPEIARSWVAGGGPIDARYVWHATAQMWQTPEVGEQLMASFTPEALAEGLAGVGVPEAYARQCGAAVDDRMKDCILRLYRSAVRVGAEWEPELANISAPGLLVWGEDDVYADVASGRRMAENIGVHFVGLDGCGHWWQLERAQHVARVIEQHWHAADTRR